METKQADTLEIMRKVEEQPGRETVGEAVYRTMAVDSGHCQGDVAIIRREKVPSAYKPVKNPNPQLAPGTDLGSHHIIEADHMKNLKFLALERPGITQGPFIVATKAFTVTHPKHKHVTLPAGTYEILYQQEQGLNQIRRAID